MTTATQKLSDAGVSIWLDDLSRERLTSGSLVGLIEGHNVVGVTTNPTIFAAALGGEGYEEQVAELASGKSEVDPAIFEITTHDVREAADILRPVHDATGGADGRVSIEVSPELAHDTEATVAQAKMLHEKVARPNVHIKIPATKEGLPAITSVIAAGISVNVTLIFSLERYRAVIDAYLTGLEMAKKAGIDISTIHSVASVFVSRIDAEVDKRLERIGTEEALALKSKAALANARLSYELYEQELASDRVQSLVAAGANMQRPLWASTGVKDPSLPDTLYVTELVADNTVNTMPEKTLMATSDHGEISGDTITGTYEESRRVMEGLKEVGIDFTEVTDLLEEEGVDKFIASWKELQGTVDEALRNAGVK